LASVRWRRARAVCDAVMSVSRVRHLTGISGPVRQAVGSCCGGGPGPAWHWCGEAAGRLTIVLLTVLLA
jgi:hypothetical protein